MKSFALCLLVIACVVAEDSRLSGVDVEAFLNNGRAYQQMMNCLMETGPCSPVGKEIKQRIPDAIATTCGKCTPAEKKATRKAINVMMKSHKSDWDKLVKKYTGNATAEHMTRLQGFLLSED